MANKARWNGLLSPKQWMPIVGILSVAIIALAVLLVLNRGDGEAAPSSTGSGRVPTHEHADFAVFIRGQQFDFNKPEFVTSEGDAPISANVHIHDPRYTVAHVHTTQTTWDEFFTSIGFTVTDPSFPGIDSPRTCMTFPDKTKLCNTDTEKWKFVANGVQVDGMSNVNVSELSRVLFSYGPETAADVLRDQYPKVSTQACIPSELCLDRINPNDPKEPCTGKGVCAK